MLASGASDLRNFLHFYILKLQHFVDILQILCLRNIFIFRCQKINDICKHNTINAVSFLQIIFMVWCYTTINIPTKPTIERMYRPV